AQDHRPNLFVYWLDRPNRYLKLQNNRRGTPWFSKKPIDGGMVEDFEVNMAQYAVWLGASCAIDKNWPGTWQGFYHTRVKYNTHIDLSCNTVATRLRTYELYQLSFLHTLS
ncbi:MAG: hypothetical protein KJO26_06665, partial [Deltaproteobacteria bacterium]|nr:hypothetical protein [Deltaproteobacteria bacterium]